MISNDMHKAMTWWTADKDQAHKPLFDMIAHIHVTQQGRQDMNLRCALLYGNYPISGLTPMGYQSWGLPVLPENRVKYNIVSSMCDTVTSKIAKMKPRVRFLTDRGNWDVQERAKQLTQFNDGLLQRNDIHTLHQQMFKDATIFDVGAIKHYRDGNRVVSERAWGPELMVESSDAMYGNPRSLYQVKHVPKAVLRDTYSELAFAIERANATISAVDAQVSNSNDFVVVTEAWHLPSSPGAKDGRHVICISNETILDEKWTKDYYPFTFYRWATPVIGFYGQSLAERLMGNQVEINKMLRIIQRSFHLGSAFKVFLEYGSKVAKEQLNNEIGSVVYYSGAKPDYFVPQVVHPEYFQHLNFLIQSSYEEAGVSQLSASAKMPAGIDGGSGKALREYNDLETERFIINSQQYEKTFLTTSKILIDLVKEVGEDYAVVAESKDFVKTIKWADIKLEDNEFVMKMFPVSSLPTTPAGRLKYVEELIQAGFVNPAFAKDLLEFPDVEEYMSLDNAIVEDIKWTAYKMLYEGEYNPPEPMQGLQLGVDTMRLYYLRAKKDGAPEARLDLLLRWITSADAMVQQSAANQQVVQNPTQVLPEAAPIAGP